MTHFSLEYSVWILLLLPVLSGCSFLTGSDRHKVQYDVTLQEVLVDGQSVQSSDSVTGSTEQKTDGMTVRFRDERLEVSWALSSTSIGLTIKNQTDHRLRINWSDTAYKPGDYRARSLVRTGSPHDHKPRTPVSIAPCRTFEGSFRPRGYDQTVDEFRSYEHELFPSRQKLYESDRSFRRRARSWVGPPIRLTLPIDTDGRRIAYTFVVQFVDLEVSNRPPAE